MKRLIITLFVLLLAASNSFAGDAFGSVFGTLTTAKSISYHQGAVALNGGIGDDINSVTASFTYGISDFTDIRLKGGFADPEGHDPKIAVGIDFKFQLLDVDGISAKPFDFSFGGTFEYMDLPHGGVLQAGAFALGSYPVLLKNGNFLSPYCRLGARLERLKVSGKSDTDIEFGVNIGVKYNISDYIGAYGEAQLDGNNGIFFGVDYLVF